MRRIVDKLVTLNFSITKRKRLSQLLNIPTSVHETIELEASGKNEKRIALTKIISHWLCKNKDASLKKLAETLDTLKINPSRKMSESENKAFKNKTSEKIRMLIGDNYLKECDVESIMEELASASIILDSISLAKELNMLHCLPCTAANNPKKTLKTWIGRSLGHVTWNHLIDHMNQVNKVAAKKIKSLISGDPIAAVQA